MRAHVLIPIVVLLLAAQSCCCCTMMGGPQPPYSITPSEDLVRQLEERLDSLTSAPGGPLTLTVTDEEITSLVASRLDRLEQQGQAPPIRDPQVFFRNGRVEAYATLEFSESLALPCMLALSITVEGGVPVVTIEEIVAGPLPVPIWLVRQLNDTINQQIAEAFARPETEFAVVDVQIGEGQMTLTVQTSPH